MVGDVLRSREPVYLGMLKKIKSILREIDDKQFQQVLDALLIIKAKGKKVLVMGAGRSGLVGRAFAMRLMHLGFDVHVLGDTITPALGKGDLAIVVSGSGTTKLVLTAAEAAKLCGAKILAITSFPESPLGKLADYILQIKGRTKVAQETDYFSRQILGEHEPLAPLGTLFELSAMIVLDSLIAELMKKLETTEAEMAERHTNIE